MGFHNNEIFSIAVLWTRIGMSIVLVSVCLWLFVVGVAMYYSCGFSDALCHHSSTYAAETSECWPIVWRATCSGRRLVYWDCCYWR